MSGRRSGLSLVELLVVMALIAVLAGMALPGMLRARMAANEAAAGGALRSVVAAQTCFRQGDADRNGVADHWVLDLSGLHRLERMPEGGGVPIALLDGDLARADDDKAMNGIGAVGAPMPDTGTPPAALLPLLQTAPRSGYLYRAIRWIEPGTLYRQDPDGNGESSTHGSRFAFQARPERYAVTGAATLFVDESGTTWARDFGDARPDNTEVWPGPEPTATGWIRRE